MEAFQLAVLVLTLAAIVWFVITLQRRIDFLEHEVRWLRSELESLKPREIRSAND